MSKYSELIEQTRAAIGMAEAHQKMIRAPEFATWREVQRSWEAAALLTKTDTLNAYCIRNAKNAYKQASFAEALVESDPLIAEQILYSLCNDPLLRSGWDVWYRHADFCLRTVIYWLERGNISAPSGAFLDKASDSLVQATRRDGDVAQLKDDLRVWRRVVNGAAAIQKALTTTGSTLTLADVRNAVQAHEDVTDLPQRAQDVFDQLWQQRRDDAIERLRRQFQQSQETVAQIDNIVALGVLSPTNSYVDQLEGIVAQALDELTESADALLDDDTGQQTLLYLQRTTDVVPKSAEIAHQQTRLTGALAHQIATLEKALSYVRTTQAVSLTTQQHQLSELQARVESWHTAVRTLAKQLDDVARLGEIGLATPQQLADAEYIVREPAIAYSGHTQIDKKFKSHNHIAVEHFRAWLRQQRARLDRQKAFKRQIEQGLTQEKHAHAVAKNLLGGQVEDEDEAVKVLEKAHNALKTVQQKLQEMAADEPDDVCGLQRTLQYTSQDDGKFYRDLPNIQTAVEAKLQQYRAGRQWLDKFSMAHGTVVSWDAAKQEILRLREKGRQSLAAALWFAKAVRGDEVATTYSAEWTEKFNFVTKPASRYGTISPDWHVGNRAEHQMTLAHAAQRMSRAELFAAIPSADTTNHLAGLYTISAIIEYERRKRQLILKTLMEEVDEILFNLQQRWEAYPDRWSAVEAAYVKLLSTRRNVLRTRHWSRFKEARDQFCQICCQDPQFIELIRDLNLRKQVPLQLSECVCES